MARYTTGQNFKCIELLYVSESPPTPQKTNKK